MQFLLKASKALSRLSFLRLLPGAGTRGITHDPKTYYLSRLGLGRGLPLEGSSSRRSLWLYRLGKE